MSADRLPASNWRPTRVSTAAAGAVALLATIGVGVSVGATTPTALGLVAGVALAGAVGAVSRTAFRGSIALASGLALLSGIATVAGLVAALLAQFGLPPEQPLPLLEFAPLALFLAGSVAGFGAPTAWWGLSPGGDVGGAAWRLLVVGLVPAAVAVVAMLGPPMEPVSAALGDLIDIVLVRGDAVPTGPPTVQLVVTVVLLSVAAFAVQWALGSLPIVELAGEETKAETEAAVASARRALGIAGIVAGVGAFFLATTVQFPQQLYGRLPAALRPVLVAFATSTALRWLFVSLSVGSGVAIAGTKAVRAAASERFRPDVVPLGPLLAGALSVLVAQFLHPTVRARAMDAVGNETGRRLLAELFASVGSFSLTLAALCVGLAVAALLLASVGIASAFGFVGPAAGAQFVAGGALFAAIAAAVAGLDAAVVVVAVAANLLAWDLGEYGSVLGSELGRRGTTRRGEAVHATGGVALAAAGGLGAAAAAAAVDIVPSGSSPLSAFVAVAAVVGTLVLFVATR